MRGLERRLDRWTRVGLIAAALLALAVGAVASQDGAASVAGFFSILPNNFRTSIRTGSRRPSAPRVSSISRASIFRLRHQRTQLCHLPHPAGSLEYQPGHDQAVVRPDRRDPSDLQPAGCGQSREGPLESRGAPRGLQHAAVEGRVPSRRRSPRRAGGGNTIGTDQLAGLVNQAGRNVTGARQGQPAPPAVIADIVAFETSLSTAQVFSFAPMPAEAM